MSQDCPFAISPKAPVREGAHEEGEEEMADEETGKDPPPDGMGEPGGVAEAPELPQG